MGIEYIDTTRYTADKGFVAEKYCRAPCFDYPLYDISSVDQCSVLIIISHETDAICPIWMKTKIPQIPRKNTNVELLKCSCMHYFLTRRNIPWTLCLLFLCVFIFSRFPHRWLVIWQVLQLSILLYLYNGAYCWDRSFGLTIIVLLDV